MVIIASYKNLLYDFYVIFLCNTEGTLNKQNIKEESLIEFAQKTSVLVYGMIYAYLSKITKGIKTVPFIKIIKYVYMCIYLFEKGLYITPWSIDSAERNYILFKISQKDSSLVKRQFFEKVIHKNRIPIKRELPEKAENKWFCYYYQKKAL